MKQPKLRFNADDGTKFPDWKEKRLNDVCEYNKGQSVGINYVGTENMKQDFSGVNDLDSENKVKGVTYNIGDTLMSNIRPYLKKTWKADIKGVCSTDVLVFHPTNINSDYLYRNISSEKFISYVMTAAKGSKMPRGDKEHIMNYDIQVPCLPEQQKIASLFAEIDTLIQSAEKELDGYRELKQGMLQKMFPKKGEKVPEIRFPEFTGDWEQHKLGEVAPLRGGYAFKSDKYKTEGTPIVRISNILSDGSVGAEFAYYDDIEDDEKCTLGNGDALLAMSGATTGKVSILKCNNNDKYYQNQRVGYFERNEQYNYGFVSTIVRSDLFKEQLTLVLVAGAQPNVSSKEIDAFEFMFPNSIVEQKKIGEYFSNLDNLIALQQQELDGYKELKKGLLQQMFC